MTMNFYKICDNYTRYFKTYFKIITKKVFFVEDNC